MEKLCDAWQWLSARLKILTKQDRYCSRYHACVYTNVNAFTPLTGKLAGEKSWSCSIFTKCCALKQTAAARWLPYSESSCVTVFAVIFHCDQIKLKGPVTLSVDFQYVV